MNSYGQFCAIARALEVLGERWTLLIVRELLLGEQHFNDISRGIPRISKTMLSARLKDLQDTGIVTRGSSGYQLTEAGLALAPVLRELGGWAMTWDSRGLRPEHLDPAALIWDIRRRVVPERLPALPWWKYDSATMRPAPTTCWPSVPTCSCAPVTAGSK